MPDFWTNLKSSGDMRPTLINWPQQLQNVKDQYLSRNASIPAGVQKDAIQNGWDARTSRKHGRGWGMSFHLDASSKPRWFMFTDWGTHGLTGRVLTEEDLDRDDLPDEERWGRFENLAFTKTGEKGSLGARGQGKFIFVAASQENRIVYDSLRCDGSYRLGTRWLERTQCPVVCFDGDSGRRQLRDYCEDIPALEQYGTRVMIDKPSAELVKAVRSGEFARLIATTWWEILRNYKVQITVDTGDGSGALAVTAPPEMDMPEKDTALHVVLLREHLPVKVGRDTYYIAKLHVAAVKDGPVQDDVRGIALQRGGMRVMNFGVPHIPDDISSRLYGYCRFEEDLDEEMKKLEDPTHFYVNLGRGVGRKVREVIEKEVQDFAEKRLGAPGAPSDDATNRDAAKRAMLELNRLAKSLGVTLRGIGTTGGGGGGGAAHPIRVTYGGGLLFPRSGSARVNYGESLKAESLCVANDLPHEIHIKVKVYLVHKQAGEDRVLLEKTLNMKAQTEETLAEPFELRITRDEFGKGEWVLKNRIIAMARVKVGKEEFAKGKIINEAGRRFWVEEDPPEAGLFEDVQAREFQPPDHQLQHRVRSGSVADRRILEYNTAHEAYQSIKSDSERVEDYVFERACMGLIEVDLASEKPKLVACPENLCPSDLFVAGAAQVARLLNTHYGG